MMSSHSDLQLRPSDVIVIVLGLTGVGKSSFIQSLTGEDTGVGHGLCSATSTFGLYCFDNGERKVFLVDTPGFNDTNRSDTTIFKDLVFFLVQSHKVNVRIGGVLYLHRIKDNRVTGSGVHAFSLVEKMCGPPAAKSAALVTTGWDTIPVGSRQYQEATHRQEELVNTDNYWGSMRRMGSHSQKWVGTRESARAILADLLQVTDSCGPPVLQIQREIIDNGLDLDDTAAGRVLSRHHGTIWQQLRKDLKSLTTSYEEARRVRDGHMAAALHSQKIQVQSRLEAVEKSQRDLRDDIASLLTKKTKMYEQIYLDARTKEAETELTVRELEEESKKIESGLLEATEVYHEETLRHQSTQSGARTTEERRHRNKLQRKRKERYEDTKLRHQARKHAIESEIVKAKKRQVLQRNLIPILGMLGGVAAMAAGGATLQIPIVAAGVALFGTAALKLDFRRTEKRKKEDEWEVQEYDDS